MKKTNVELEKLNIEKAKYAQQTSELPSPYQPVTSSDIENLETQLAELAEFQLPNVPTHDDELISEGAEKTKVTVSRNREGKY